MNIIIIEKEIIYDMTIPVGDATRILKCRFCGSDDMLRKRPPRYKFMLTHCNKCNRYQEL